MQIEYQINSVVLKRLVQKSVDTRTQLFFVYDRDQKDNIINVGYFFQNNKDEKTEIIWFNKSEIIVKKITQKSEVNIPFRGKLQVSFNHPKIQERDFLVNVPINSDLSLIFRCIYREKLNINNFVIQIELEGKKSGKIRGRKTLVRYDCAHGFLHRDLINVTNQQIKEKIIPINKKNPIKQIINEIPDNLNRWLKRLGHHEIDEYKIKNKSVLDELHEAGSKLEKLLNRPEEFVFTKSNLTTFTE